MSNYALGVSIALFRKGTSVKSIGVLSSACARILAQILCYLVIHLLGKVFLPGLLFAQSISNSTFGQVVRSQLDFHAIAR